MEGAIRAAIVSTRGSFSAHVLAKKAFDDSQRHNCCVHGFVWIACAEVMDGDMRRALAPGLADVGEDSDEDGMNLLDDDFVVQAAGADDVRGRRARAGRGGGGEGRGCYGGVLIRCLP